MPEAGKRCLDGGGLTAAATGQRAVGMGWLRAALSRSPVLKQGPSGYCMEGQGSGGVLLTIEVFSKTSPLRVPFMGPATPVQFMPRGA